METLGNRLSKARKRARLTQNQAAELLGVVLRTIQNHEAGTHRPSDEDLRTYCDMYKCSWVWLLTGDGEKFINKDGMVQEVEPPYAVGTTDGEGLFGKTYFKEVEGQRVSVPTFDPKTSRPQAPADPLAEAMSGLLKIFNSGDQESITAITSNIQSFQTSVEKDHKIKELQGQITLMKRDMDVLMKRISVIEQTSRKLVEVETVFVKHSSSIPEERRAVMKEIAAILAAKDSEEELKISPTPRSS